MTHAAMPETERLKRGITPALLRLSIGIENRNDLKRDLEKALIGYGKFLSHLMG
jgi:cystathionine beta-lyase/cystathionine gamma-synthase